jgi:hypothetical protein
MKNNIFAGEKSGENCLNEDLQNNNINSLIVAKMTDY